MTNPAKMSDTHFRSLHMLANAHTGGLQALVELDMPKASTLSHNSCATLKHMLQI